MTWSFWDCYRCGINIGYNPLRLFPLSIIPQSLSKSLGLSVVYSFLWQVITEFMVWNHHIWPILRHFICLECGTYRWALLFLDNFLIDCFSLASICRQSKSLERGSCNHYSYLIKSWVEPRVTDSAELFPNSLVSASGCRLGFNSYLPVKCLPWSQGRGEGSRRRGQCPGCHLPRGVPV